ncbi:MAG: histidine kinase [Gammaproteobacteria bacterium]|nr:histidine kinase [Gammaproteobacteria bacterium]MCP5195363.1 histidine kinase [Gammaproteobacteria bacterium]
MLSESVRVNTFREDYIRLIKDYWLHGSEEHLIQAAELGKRLVHEELPPEEIGEFQQFALIELKQIAPATSLDEVANRLTPPLIEVLMAYGLAFRQQLQEHYELMVGKHLEQASRLEALGTLSSGIAHDFNTLLGVILGYTEMTLDRIPHDSVARQNLEQVIIAAQRARDLVARILAFGRRDDQKRRTPQRMADSLNECLTMLRSMLPPSVTLHLHIDQPEIWVLGDASELQQLIMDLTVNAIDAMAERGEIHFSLDAITLDADTGQRWPDLSPGDYVRFRIRDTGCGVSPQIANRIFEPFFTTKDVGEGTGLGLSVVYGIVKRMGGAIRLNSEPGQPGAEFEILCPRYAGSEP